MPVVSVPALAGSTRVPGEALAAWMSFTTRAEGRWIATTVHPRARSALRGHISEVAPSSTYTWRATFGVSEPKVSKSSGVGR
eukprot:8372288-Pyramimonas_sp.AAC.1